MAADIPQVVAAVESAVVVVVLAADLRIFPQLQHLPCVGSLRDMVLGLSQSLEVRTTLILDVDLIVFSYLCAIVS